METKLKNASFQEIFGIFRGPLDFKSLYQIFKGNLSEQGFVHVTKITISCTQPHFLYDIYR